MLLTTYQSATANTYIYSFWQLKHNIIYNHGYENKILILTVGARKVKHPIQGVP